MTAEIPEKPNFELHTAQVEGLGLQTSGTPEHIGGVAISNTPEVADPYSWLERARAAREIRAAAAVAEITALYPGPEHAGLLKDLVPAVRAYWLQTGPYIGKLTSRHRK